MAYDQELANRIRAELDAAEDVREKRMFGGLGFMVAGNLAVSASGEGGLLVRVGPAGAEDALARSHTSPMVMRGRTMAGWVRVAPAGVKTKRQLAAWVRRGTAAARSLPAKGD